MKLDQLVGVGATALFCGIAFTTVTVRAGNNNWTNTTGGNWIDGSNWSGGAPSSTFGILYITNATSKIVALWDGFTPASTLIVSNLEVSAPGASTNTLTLGYNGLGQSFPMADGPLQILDLLVIGVGGAFVQGVATTMVEGVSGFFSTAFLDDGSVTISNGLLVVTNAAINIGATGQFNLDGGTVLAKQLAASSPGGTINLNSGSLVSQSTIVSNGQDFTIGSSGGGGSATFMANGGAHTIQNNLIVGGATSNNQLVVSNAASVFNGYGYIGLDPVSLYNVGTVTGPGSFWINSDNLSVGYSGRGNALVIANGGVVSNVYGNIGYEDNANYNGVDIFDTGSVWNNSGTMTVGTSGVGNSLYILNGGAVFNTYGYIGYNASANNNEVFVTGAGSVWNNSADVYVGYSGSGNTLTIGPGSAFVQGVNNANGWIGFNANSNAGTVTGAGSIWNNSGSLTVGVSGSGNTLTITNGGAVYDVDGTIGYNTGAKGNAVTVVGSGAVWNNSNDLFIGYSGTSNALTIANGGAVYSASSAIGLGNMGESSNNTVLVTGAGSVWNNSDDLFLGVVGSGNSLTITNSGAVYTLYGYIGANGNGNTVTVTGTGSVWNISADEEGAVTVGYGGSGNTLTIANGGAVYNTGGSIGIDEEQSPPGANSNTVTVTGAGSVWNNSSDIVLGYSGSGNTLTIANGGIVYGGGIIGDDPSSFNNAVTVTGAGSVWNAGGGLIISEFGSGNTVTITSSGSLFVTNAAGNGTLLVSSVNLGDLQNGPAGTGSLIINGGSVTVNALIASNGLNSVVTFQAGLLTSSGTSVNNNQLFVVGDGTDAATFQLNGGVHSFVNNLEIRNNATLTGCGTIEGNVTIDPGGTVVAACGGTLTFSGIVTNNGTMQAVNGTVLQAYGLVVNNGLINVNNGSTEFFGGLVNNGVVLTENDAQISSITRSGNNITIQIPSVTDASYQLQFSPSLKPATWTSLGASQDGTGGVLTFTDTGGATNRPGRFYRIDITLP
jgi:T5SS/PEP-CTERM-associated repeat protein